jgi:hypothetical protein
MNKVNWKDGAHKRAQAESVQKTNDRVGNAIKEMVSRQSYMSPEEKARKKSSLLKNFKSNILSLENSFENLNVRDDHHDIVKKSFNIKENTPTKIKNGN